ncbi:cell growth regulator with EF hand domain protein 1 [Ara ararauna]
MGPGAGQTLLGRAHPVQTVKRMRDQPRRWRLGCERGSPGTPPWSRPGAGVCHGRRHFWCWHGRRVPVNPYAAGLTRQYRRSADGSVRPVPLAGDVSATWPQVGLAAPRLYAVRRPALPPPPGASVSSPRWTRWTLPGPARPSHGCRSRPVPAGSGKGGRGRHCDLPMGRSLCSSHPTVASSRWMRKALALLLLLVSGVPAAPQGGGHRPEDPAAMRLDPDFDLLSPELPTLLLLQRTVQSLAMPEQDVEALTREQVLLYLFVLHDHDRNGHLDGLELLQLLSTVLAQRNGRQPHLDMVAVLVDQALERQDVSRDGLLNPPELLLDPPKQLLSPGQGQGAPGPPLLPHPREPEVLGGNMGVNGPGLGPAEKQEEGQEALQAEIPQAESPDGGLMEVEDTLKIEAPEAEAPKAEAAPVWGDPREG